MAAPAPQRAPVTTLSQRSYPTAALAAQAWQADALRSQVAMQGAFLIQQVMQLWSLLDLSDVQASWPAVQAGLESVIREQFPVAAQAGNAYFLQARAAAGVPGAPPVLELPPAPEERLIRITLQVTGPRALLKRIKATQPVPEAVRNTGVVMSGAAMRLVVNGARQAVLQAVDADAKAVAWMRVTASDPCAFCAMLAGRGPIYRTEASAGFKAHSRCRCTAAAVFSRADAKALRDNDLSRQWQQATRGYGGKDALNAWRRYWENANPGVLGAPQVA